MKKIIKHQDLLHQLEASLQDLEKSLLVLTYSYRKCQKINPQKDFSQTDLDNFELLTSRFARTSDILTQKVLKTLFLIIGKDIHTIIDASNLLEKLEIIEKAETLLNLRSLRNQIAHEYSTDDLPEVFKETLSYTSQLFKIIENTKKYIKKHL
jgi:uncharacterized protein with HEPN domain